MEDLIIKALIVYGIEMVHKNKHTLKAAMTWSLALLLAQEVYWKFEYINSTWRDDIYDVIFSAGWAVGQMLALVALVEIVHRVSKRLLP